MKRIILSSQTLVLLFGISFILLLYKVDSINKREIYSTVKKLKTTSEYNYIEKSFIDSYYSFLNTKDSVLAENYFKARSEITKNLVKLGFNTKDVIRLKGLSSVDSKNEFKLIKLDFSSNEISLKDNDKVITVQEASDYYQILAKERSLIIVDSFNEDEFKKGFDNVKYRNMLKSDDLKLSVMNAAPSIMVDRFKIDWNYPIN
ncbi:MAG: hypothetical protein M3R36_08450 [Bacteroidota bacterium]|nr:hypothetical protein [Bacteroidota bacterium]